MCENHNRGKARESQDFGTEVVLWLRWCSWLLPGASGHVFRRFWGRFGMDFRYFWERFLGCVFCIETRHVLAGVGTALFFGAEFSHSLGKKFALTRTTHPQQPLSKGGGLAKRPQSAAPVAGVSGTLVHT